MTQITIPNVPTEVEYSVTSSSTGPFTVPFPFFEDDDVQCLVTDAAGVETTLVVTTDFTWTTQTAPVGQEGNGYSGGTITLVSAIGSDGATTLKIFRSTVIDRTANYPNTGPFSVPLLNDEQNNMIAIMQELSQKDDDNLAFDAAARAILQADIDANEVVSDANHLKTVRAGDVSLTELPGAASRANKYVHFTAGGDAEVAEVVDAGTTLSQSVIGGHLYPQTTGEATLGITPTAYHHPPGNVLRYGAVGDDVTDDHLAIVSAIDVAVADKVWCVFPGGYTFRCETETIFLISGDVHIRGPGILHLVNERLTLNRIGWSDAGLTETKIASDITRGDLTIEVDDATDLAEGQILYIADYGVVVESGWSYTTQETHKITDVTGTTVTLDRPASFDYTAASPTMESLDYRECYHVTLRDLNVWCGGDELDATATFRVFYSTLDARNCHFWNEYPKNDKKDGLSLRYNVGSVVDGVRMENLKYGVVGLRCVNTTVSNVIAYKCRHVYDAQIWSDYNIIKNVFANHCTGAIESHPCFNTFWSDIYSLNESLGPSPRCLGLTVSNCYVHKLGTHPGYWANVNMVDDTIEDEYTILIENYIEDAPNVDQSGGPGAFQGGRLIMRGCDVQQIQSSATESIIDGCKAATIRIANEKPTKLIINNCTFDGDLMYPGGTTSGIYCDGENLNEVTITNTKIINQDRAIYEQHAMDAADNPYRLFTNCTFDNLAVNLVVGGLNNNHRFSSCILSNSGAMSGNIHPAFNSYYWFENCQTFDTTTKEKMMLNVIKSLDNSATPSIAGRELWRAPWAITMTDFTDGVFGQTLTILGAVSNVIIQDNAAIFLNGGTDYTMGIGDTLILKMLGDGIWYEIGRSEP